MTKIHPTSNPTKKTVEEPEEAEAPRIHDTIMKKETQEEDGEFEEPQIPADPP